MRSICLSLVLAGSPVVLLAACGGGSEPTPGDGDTDTDSDTDSDVDTDSDSDGDTHPDDLVFENVIRTYDLLIDESDWAWLNEHATLEQYVPGVLLFDGERYEQVGVRYKGGFGALYSCFDARGERICPKLSIKVSFNEYDPEGRFHGLKKLQFHSMNKDPSQMRERVSYALFREAGVVAPRTTYALLRVNGEDLGLFVIVEEIDGRFTRRHFEEEGGEGNLYKEVWPQYIDERPYLDALKTNRDESPSAARMVEFARALDEVPDDQFLDVLGDWMDLDGVYAYLAVDRGISNWDGIVAWYCSALGCGNHNYYWYEEVLDDRVWLIPWDLDLSFQPSPWETHLGVPGWLEEPDTCEPYEIWPGVGVRAPACDPLVERLGRLAWDGYVDAAGRFLDGSFREDDVLDRIDEHEAQIEDIVAADGNGPGLVAFRAAVDELRALVPRLRRDLADEIGR